MKFLTEKEINDFCDFADAQNKSEEYWKEAIKAYKQVYTVDPLVLDSERIAAFVQTNLAFQYFTKQG